MSTAETFYKLASQIDVWASRPLLPSTDQDTSDASAERRANWRTAVLSWRPSTKTPGRLKMGFMMRPGLSTQGPYYRAVLYEQSLCPTEVRQGLNAHLTAPWPAMRNTVIRSWARSNA